MKAFQMSNFALKIYIAVRALENEIDRVSRQGVWERDRQMDRMASKSKRTKQGRDFFLKSY